jgi:hypothetical protein
MAPFQILGMEWLYSVFGRQNRVILFLCLVLESERTGQFYPVFGSRVQLRYKI